MAICGHGIAVTIKKPLISPKTECRPESSKIIDPRYDVHTIMDDILVRLSEFKVENVFTLERLERSDLDSILTCQAKNSNVTTSSDCSTLTVLLLLGLTLHTTWRDMSEDLVIITEVHTDLDPWRLPTGVLRCLWWTNLSVSWPNTLTSTSPSAQTPGR